MGNQLALILFFTLSYAILFHFPPLVLRIFGGLFLLAFCSSSVKITSSPTQADVYADGLYVGQTPMRHRDAKVSGTVLNVRLEKDGLRRTQYPDLQRRSRECLSCLFSGFVIPLAWILGYTSRHYVMKSLEEAKVFEIENQNVRVEVQSRSDLGEYIFVVALDNTPCQGSSRASMLEAAVGIRLMGTACWNGAHSMW